MIMVYSMYQMKHNHIRCKVLLMKCMFVADGKVLHTLCIGNKQHHSPKVVQSMAKMHIFFSNYIISHNMYTKCSSCQCDSNMVVNSKSKIVTTHWIFTTIANYLWYKLRWQLGIQKWAMKNIWFHFSIYILQEWFIPLGNETWIF